MRLLLRNSRSVARMLFDAVTKGDESTVLFEERSVGTGRTIWYDNKPRKNIEGQKTEPLGAQRTLFNNLIVEFPRKPTSINSAPDEQEPEDETKAARLLPQETT